MKKKKEYLTACQLALILDISEKTVKLLVKNNELPCKYVNRRLQFNTDTILKHFEKLEGGAA